jgi:hypothetical protein
MNLTFGARLGQQAVGIDPERAYRRGPVNGRDAQIAGIARLLGEQAKSTQSGSSQSRGGGRLSAKNQSLA